MISAEKQALRRAIRAAFPGPEERARESETLCRLAADWHVWRGARVVGGYMPLPWEADVTPLMRWALAAGKTLLLPRVEGDRLSFRHVSRLDGLPRGRWGIPEPPEDAQAVPAGAMDLLLVPLEGVDPSGMRLGKGGGYYDRLLPGLRAVTLGAALSWQWAGRVPAEPWDQPLDAAVDRQGIHPFKR